MLSRVVRYGFFPKMKEIVYHFKKSSYSKMGILFCVTCLIVGILTDRIHLMINQSSSYPERYFLHLPKVNPSKGDITIYEHTSGKRLIKKIIGMEGDRIAYDRQGFLWVGKTKVGKPHTSNPQGIMLHALPACVIPRDHVFLYAPHNQSLDSRYQEVGLVYRKYLIGKAIAIF